MHLAWTDEVAVFAATDKVAWDEVVLQAIGDPEGFVDVEALAGAKADRSEILARWRAPGHACRRRCAAIRPGEKMPWFGPPMSPTSMATARFMETWAHGLDVAEALGVTPEPTDRIRHVAHLGVRTRNYAYSVQSLEPPAEEFRIELRAPSGELWEWGPVEAEQTVRGSAYDFCLRVTQRRHRDDLDLVATGPDANRWLDIAQAFAGPRRDGSPPRWSSSERSERSVETLRVGNCSGFYGDRLSAMRELLKGGDARRRHG